MGCLKIQGKWVELMSLLAVVPKLHSFRFDAFEPMPSFLVQQLELYHPTARLEIRNWTRHSDDTDHMDTCEAALSKSINLRSIHADIWASNYDIDLRMPALMRIISLAPNLEEIKIRGEKDTTLLSFFHAPSEGMKRNKMAQFRQANCSKALIRSIESLGDDYLSMLGSVVDFSFVESLRIDARQNLSTISTAGAILDKLRHLSIEYTESSRGSDHEFPRAIGEFVLGCRRLESLEMVGSRTHNIESDKIIKYHGSSTKRLAFFDNTNNQPETSMIVGQSCPDLSTLESMRDFCPALEDVGINIRPTQDDSLDPITLSMVAGIIHLQTLRLRCAFPFEMNRGYDSSEASIESYGTKFRASSGRWIVNLWFFIQARRKENGFRPVKEVHLMYPEHIRASLGPRNFSLDIVTASGRDDCPDEIMVQGNIPGSTRTTRRILRRNITNENNQCPGKVAAGH